MLSRLKQWNDDQRAKARARMAGNEATLRAGLTPAWAQTPHADVEDVRAWMRDNERHRRASFAGVHLFNDHIVRLSMWPMPGGVRYPLAGVTASVSVAGGYGARATLTRSMVPGLHGWQKPVDTREAVLTVDGPQFQWVIPLHPAGAGAARRFAATVTTAGRAART